MAATRTTTDTVMTRGARASTTPSALRQSGGALGPRAQRTIARIVEATREVFLTRGYSGTTIDEIARIAEVSRASFYTYFPSKREVLLALGAHDASESMAVIDRLAGSGTTRASLTEWVAEYFEFLDVHGSFSLAWTQAAQEDETIRATGMKGHLRICRKLGSTLAETAGRTAEDPAVLGLVAASLLERSWNFSQLYFDTIDRSAVIAQSAQALWGAVRQLPLTANGTA
ncbi:MAG: TetR/AcrR family transcriptional regulator [Acidimicrobiia bacterium]